MARLTKFLLPFAAILALTGCPAPNDSGGTGNDDIGDVSDTALSFSGTLSGTATDSSSTDAATSGESSRKFASRSLGDSANATLTDVNGDPLLDANGEAYGEFPINTDGSFALAGLPVGVDFVINIDTDGDGTADLVGLVNIPADENAAANEGSLEDYICDPLSTMVAFKLFELIEELGGNPEELGISLSGLIERVRDVFENLFADLGVDQQITLDDLRGRTRGQIASLFDSLIPDVARLPMDMTRNNIDLAKAQDVQAVVKAVAGILLRGGFTIADAPDGFDLSFLGEIEGVEQVSFEAFYEQKLADQGADGPAAIGDFPNAPTLYRSTIREPNRNDPEALDQHGPIFSEYVLTAMARLFLDGKTITVDELYQIVVDAEIGMGARFTFPGYDSEFGPVSLFESASGGGVFIDLSNLFAEIDAAGLNNPDPAELANREQAIRDLISDLLDGTAEPDFERLFAGILIGRIPDPRGYGQYLREQRAHVPFSRTGPSTIFVVADASTQNVPGQQQTGEQPDAVTVNVTFDEKGQIVQISYNPNGEGQYLLGFGPPAVEGQNVRVVSRLTGRDIRDFRGGPLLVNMIDADIFQPVNGESFFDAFSEDVAGYPLAPFIRLPNPHYDPNQPSDPETNPADFPALVLLNPTNNEPAKVSYDGMTVTADENGEFYLLATERTQNENLFALVDKNGLSPSERGDLDFDGGAPIIEDAAGRTLVNPSEVVGLPAAPGGARVFGTEVPNAAYDPAGAPFWDDIDSDGVQDANEPFFSERYFLGNPADWRSTFVERYYRRADTDGFFDNSEVNWNSNTPALLNGTALEPRNFQPRLNGFRFGRPNVTMNLLMAFSPPEFFNGTQSLDSTTNLNVFQALAILNLVFDSVHNTLVTVDFDGPGPQSAHETLVNSDLFVLPIGDPLVLVVDAFEDLAANP